MHDKSVLDSPFLGPEGKLKLGHLRLTALGKAVNLKTKGYSE